MCFSVEFFQFLVGVGHIVMMMAVNVWGGKVYCDQYQQSVPFAVFIQKCWSLMYGVGYLRIESMTWVLDQG